MRELLPPLLRQIVTQTPELAQTFLVGGCVRDALLGEPVKDFDLEVFGLRYEALVQALGRWGRADLVGRSFGVVKLTTSAGTFDFSLPRRDSKNGAGHRGFIVEVDPLLTLAAASARRDFTINSLMYDLRQDVLLDPHGGQADLRARILRHTSPAFTEDPLRVLRGMQFVARFDLSFAPETVALCRQMVSTHNELAPERRREEWLKWACLSRKPSRGLEFLAETGWWVHYPELMAIQGVPQDPVWHPEGDVWRHTLCGVDELAALPGWLDADRDSRAVLMLTLLLHDLGKACTTRWDVRDGRERIVSPGHEQESVRLGGAFLERIDLPRALRERIVPLVANHMAYCEEPSARAVRRLATRLQPATLQELGVVMTADASARPPLPRRVPDTVTALLSRASAMELQNSAPKPILLGRHLLERGHRPGPNMGRLLQAAFEAQLDGEFQDLDGAVAWLEGQSSASSTCTSASSL